MMFEQLPDNLFSPLAGPNRAIYETVLRALYPLFFEHTEIELFPSREEVRAEIEEQLARRGHSDWVEEQDIPQDQDLPVNNAGFALRIYHRLVQCGWLEEEMDGYRTLVVMAPDVGRLLSTLMDISRSERVFYGGMVLSIYNNLQLAVAEPESQALAFRESCHDAQRFALHLNGMVYGLKGLLAGMADLDERRQVLGAFFEDFVERFLVADYTRLKTHNNPFRFRSRILALAQRIHHEADIRQRFELGYQEQMGLSADGARDELARDLHSLNRVFERVDHHLERIDRYRTRFERRAADTIRYLDRSIPGAAARMGNLLNGLGESLTASGLADDADPAILALPLNITRPLPIGPRSQRTPRAVRQAPSPTPLRRRQIDPTQLGRQQAMRRYVERRRIDPARVVNYLEKHIAPGNTAHAADLPIDTIEDYLAFCRIRLLPRQSKGISRRFEINIDSETWFENDYLRCRDFSVTRVQ